MTVPSPSLKNRLPDWFRQELPQRWELEKARELFLSGINTVCLEAKCPNRSGCLKRGELTFLILGRSCTRSCAFCAVEKSAGRALPLDKGEPGRVAEAVSRLKLRYAVITSVTRDDLADGGSGAFAETLKLIKGLDAGSKTEVLMPDFKGETKSLRLVLEQQPDVAAHNIETVESLYKRLRPRAAYERSLKVLAAFKKIYSRVITKSSLMLGMGESGLEVRDTMRDLADNGCDILTLGQYLAPSRMHYPVKEFIAPERFAEYKDEALALGFKAVLSGPLVRSSYRAEEVYSEVAAYA